MSVVIIGGNERMACQYKDICMQYHCKAKVFTKLKSGLREQIGNPDLVILFTSTVSHKMVRCALAEADKCNSAVERSHTSSATALKGILSNYCDPS